MQMVAVDRRATGSDALATSIAISQTQQAPRLAVAGYLLNLISSSSTFFSVGISASKSLSMSPVMQDEMIILPQPAREGVVMILRLLVGMQARLTGICPQWKKTLRPAP